MRASVKAGVVAGVLVGLFVAASFLVAPVPDRLVGLLGGPTGLARTGGLAVTFQRDAERGALVYPGIDQEVAQDLVAALAEGGLRFHEVIDLPTAEAPTADGVQADVDEWTSDDGRHRSAYLFGADPNAVEEAAARLPRSPEHAYALERIEPRFDDPTTRWRSYEIVREPAMDGSAIASAATTFDPNTNRPLVLVELTPSARDTFCELTMRLRGHKLAILLGGRIRSAPIINGAICGGHLSITGGGSDPVEQQREADMLVALLQNESTRVPDGIVVVSSTWLAAGDATAQEHVGAGLLGLLAAIVAGVGFALVVRYVRPHVVARTLALAPTRGVPWKRVLVTALGPLILVAGEWVDLPFINTIEYQYVTNGSSLTVFALGVTPIIAAFGLVELVALAVPRLRPLRHAPLGRARLGQAVAGVALVVALVQGLALALYLEQLSYGGAEVTWMAGWKFRGLVAVTLAGGTFVLVAVAGLIREHGLGNGYGVLIASGAIVAALRGHVLERISQTHAHGIVLIVVVACATVFLLRRRVGDERGVALQLPISGVVPYGDTILVLVLVALVGATGAGLGAMLLAQDTLAIAPARLAIVVVEVIAWAWILARPAVIARVAVQSGVGGVSRAAWVRATVLSGAVLVGIIALVTWQLRLEPAPLVADPITVMVLTAVVMDVAGDLRAHRRAELTPAGVLHQIQRVDLVEQVLATQGIPVHVHAVHLRSLLAFFGPWCPAIPMVPVEHGHAARTLLAEAMAEPRSA